uniref:Uncharacterized protein n=1 Tax=Romanomermis culicivorax TaxID=13658 RepID=A0A915L8V0_ROMCU
MAQKVLSVCANWVNIFGFSALHTESMNILPYRICPERERVLFEKCIIIAARHLKLFSLNIASVFGPMMIVGIGRLVGYFGWFFIGYHDFKAAGVLGVLKPAFTSFCDDRE